ncbi:HesA/MoeB/ThiF family protein [Pedobacter deserti]|uniref:HesA/MoeB/ThiF family protein n=1 Tax=Pedobacter deserti TaxID=2817382 RepID=UPI00210C8955|nr:HesA/MoeB/ThiF family protein [Pedobacter sp. SYSU D00382]
MYMNERYSRQIRLTDFGIEAQRKLFSASVLVIGAGGLGCPALQYLAAAGVGRIGIADPDVVELSNLHRQILYGTESLGLYKADAAAARLRDLNPDVAVEPYIYPVDQHNALSLFERYDYILDGTDNFESKYMISDAAAMLGKPLVFGAADQYDGQLAVFNVTGPDAIAANYRDLFPEPPGKDQIGNCADNGVLGVLPGIIGTMQAAEVIKMITGVGTALVNQLLIYDIRNQQMSKLAIVPSTISYRLPASANEFIAMNYSLNCGLSDDDIEEINAQRMEQLYLGGGTLLVDVREERETPRLDAAKFVLAPLRDFDSFLNNHYKEERIVLVCQHGIRSLHAAQQLQEKWGNDKKIYSLKGGIAKYPQYFVAKTKLS